MAIERYYINSGPEALVQWMQNNLVPKYFASFSGSYDFFDADGNKVFAFVYTSYWSMRAYTDTTNIVNLGGGGQFKVNYVYTCENGVMFDIEYFNDNYLHKSYVMITKTNNGSVAFITSTDSSDLGQSGYNNVLRVTWGDVTPVTKMTYTPITGNQTQLVQFCTDAQYDTQSYTPDAYYCPMSQNYSIGYGKINIDGVNYLSNGYWAIKDE